MQLGQKVRLPLSMLQLPGWEGQQSPLAAGAAQTPLSPQPGPGLTTQAAPLPRSKRGFSHPSSAQTAPCQGWSILCFPCSLPSPVTPAGPWRELREALLSQTNSPEGSALLQIPPNFIHLRALHPRARLALCGECYRWLQR